MLGIRTKIKLINWWPPIIGTGIRLTHISEDMTRFDVRMKLGWYNKNLLGIHYGGSLYSMCDPWYMFILILNLGKKYVVLDKAANIRYLKKGDETVYATFEITPERLQEIRDEIDVIGKNEYSFPCIIKKANGEIVCEVDKIVYVRKKDFDWDSLESKDQAQKSSVS